MPTTKPPETHKYDFEKMRDILDTLEVLSKESARTGSPDFHTIICTCTILSTRAYKLLHQDVSITPNTENQLN